MNEGDGLGTKVLCELVFNGQHRFIDILRGQLPNIRSSPEFLNFLPSEPFVSYSEFLIKKECITYRRDLL